jgi:hypothetical protein
VVELLQDFDGCRVWAVDEHLVGMDDVERFISSVQLFT